jgi:hypothetical protein
VRRARLLAASVLFAALGVASKWYTGPGREVVVGQFLDYFGTTCMVLGLRAAFVRAPARRVAGAVLAILMAIELSQLLHGGFIERIRANRIGLLVVGACFEWGDIVAYLLGTATALWIDRRIAARG